MTNFEPQYPRGQAGGTPGQPGGSPQGHPTAPQQYQQAYPQQPHGYQQQGHGQQPYGPPPTRGTNTMAILAIVFAFVFAPLGIVFGIMARNQIKNTGEEGSGLALAGIIIGAVFTAIIVIYIIFAIIVVGAAINTVNDIDFSDFPPDQG